MGSIMVRKPKSKRSGEIVASSETSRLLPTVGRKRWGKRELFSIPSLSKVVYIDLILQKKYFSGTLAISQSGTVSYGYRRLISFTYGATVHERLGHGSSLGEQLFARIKGKAFIVLSQSCPLCSWVLDQDSLRNSSYPRSAVDERAEVFRSCEVAAAPYVEE